MHADDLSGAIGLRCQFRNGDGACIRGEDGFGRKNAVEIAKERGLDL